MQRGLHSESNISVLLINVRKEWKWKWTEMAPLFGVTDQYLSDVSRGLSEGDPKLFASLDLLNQICVQRKEELSRTRIQLLREHDFSALNKTPSDTDKKAIREFAAREFRKRFGLK